MTYLDSKENAAYYYDTGTKYLVSALCRSSVGKIEAVFIYDEWSNIVERGETVGDKTETMKYRYDA